jgi:dienelactone hydrolase
LHGEHHIYLGTPPQATFANVHLPDVGARGATGVVLVPPFGWDEECTYRARRVWADALADGGHPAVRLQLPGTGDSVGELDAPARLETWREAVGAAATWLRQEHGCARVCALGLGFGATLAWLAIAEGAPVDDLILWGAPVRGRRLVRELRAAAALDIDSRLHTEAGAEPAAPGEVAGLLDEAGQLITPPLLAAIERIDLRREILPEAGRRRILLFARSGMAADQELERQLRESGAELTVLDGDVLNSMMRYIQYSVVPSDAVAGSITWLAKGAARARGPGANVPPARVAGTTSVEFVAHGARIRETPITVPVPGGRMRAVLTQPVSAREADLTVVFFSGGADRRTGPNRLWVSAARRWAADGVSAVRIDPSGVGDGDGDASAWSELRTHYSDSQVRDAVALLDAVERRGAPARFMLVGFCSGAYRSMQIALREHRVVGVCAIGLPFFHWTWWAVNIRDNWLAMRERKPTDGRLRLAALGVLQPTLRVLVRVHHRVVRLAQPLPNRGERMLRALGGRGVEVALLLKGNSFAYEQVTAPRRRSRLGRVGSLRIERLPGDDQRFRPLACQSFVNRALDQAVDRLATPRHGSAASADPISRPVWSAGHGHSSAGVPDTTSVA